MPKKKRSSYGERRKGYSKRKKKTSPGSEEALQNGEVLEGQLLDTDFKITINEDYDTNLTTTEEVHSPSVMHDGDHLYAKRPDENDALNCVLDMECETVSFAEIENVCEAINTFEASQKCDSVNGYDDKEKCEAMSIFEVRQNWETANKNQVREKCETMTTLEERHKCETANKNQVGEKCETKGNDNIILEEFLEVTIETYRFSNFVSDIREFIKKRNYLYSILETNDYIVLTKFYSSECLAVKYTIKFDSYFQCSLIVHGKPLSQSNFLWTAFPFIFTCAEEASRLLSCVETMNVCPGNLDSKFHRFASIGDNLTGKFSEVLGYREGDFGAITADGVTYTSTIRSVKCEMLVNTNETKCTYCRKYRPALVSRLRRVKEKMIRKWDYVHSTYKHEDMTREELIEKITAQRNEMTRLNQNLEKTERIIERFTTTKKIIDKESQEEVHIPSSCESTVDSSVPETEETSTEAPSTDTKPIMEENVNKCNDCKKVFTNQMRLYLHIANYAGTCSWKKSSYLKKKYYGQKTSIKHSLCNICGHKCQNNHFLEIHIRGHTGERPFKCDKCDLSFLDKRTLKRHSTKHSGTSPLKCDHCDMTFPCLYDLKMHLKTHREAATFLCDICGDAFYQSHKLMIHQRKHTGEKPHKCNICGATFRRPTNFYAHKKIHDKYKLI